MRAPKILIQTLGFPARAAALVGAMKTAWVRRRLVGHLAGFDDHMLRDIGITRGDIQSVLAASAFDDPTLRLAVRAQEARSNRRAAAAEQRLWARMIGEAEGSAAAELDRHAA